MSFIDNFGTAGSGETFGGNDMMFDQMNSSQMNSSQMKFDYPLISDGIENPDFDDRSDFLSGDPRFASSENEPEESILSEPNLSNPGEISDANARSLSMNMRMMHAPLVDVNHHAPPGSGNSSRLEIGVPGSIGMPNDFKTSQMNVDLNRQTGDLPQNNDFRPSPQPHHARLIDPLSIEKPQYSQASLKAGAHLNVNQTSTHSTYNTSHSNPKPPIATEFTPPFIVDLPMVRRTMDGVNRALGVDLTGNDVGESVLMAKPNGDLKSDESDLRDNNTAGKTEVSHARLITEACGFIVASVGRAVIEAAHESCMQDLEKGLPPSAPKAPIRKKRGGIIGFKELASRSNLSAWHFHRVFRSVTGVTPKAYGEALWEYLMLDAGFDLENEELTISRGSQPAPPPPMNRKDMSLSQPNPINGPSSLSSESPQSQGLSPGLSSATSLGSKVHSPPRSTTDARSLSRSRASSPSDIVKPEPAGDEALIKNELKINDYDPNNSSGAVITDGDESSAKSQTGNNYQPLAGTVVPGRVSKTASRSRGARSRSRNRSQSQSQVFNAFKSENGVISDEKQPIRRGRSFSRVSQRPGVLNGSSMNRTSHSVGGNPSMMTPIMPGTNGTFSPVNNRMGNSMNTGMSPGMNPNMNNSIGNDMNSQMNMGMNNGMNNGMSSGMSMMNNGMMMKNSQMSMSDDIIGDTFHPNTEMMMNNPNFAFDIPDLNNLTLYPQDGRMNHRYSTGAEQIQMLMPMNGNTGVEMPDSISTPQGIFPVPRSNSMMTHTNYPAHHYPLNAEDPFDFSALPTGSGGMDSSNRETDSFGEMPNSRHSKSVTNMSHIGDVSNNARNSLRGRHHHSQSEQIPMPRMPYTGNMTVRSNPDHDLSESASASQSNNNGNADANARYKHHRSYTTTMDNLTFDTDRMTGFQSIRSVTPPSLVSGLANNSSSATATNPPSSSSTTSTNLPTEGSQRTDFFYPGSLNWDMYNDPNDATSKSDQLGDLPPSFYGGFGDSPIFGEDNKSGNDILDLHSVMIGEEEPPLPNTWQNDANLGYASF